MIKRVFLFFRKIHLLVVSEMQWILKIFIVRIVLFYNLIIKLVLILNSVYYKIMSLVFILVNCYNSSNHCSNILIFLDNIDESYKCDTNSKALTFLEIRCFLRILDSELSEVLNDLKFYTLLRRV